MNENILLAEEKDGVMVLSLNRLQVMNSLNFPLLHALREKVESVRFKTHTRVIIITGAGEKAFCAGADLKERATLTPDQVKEFIFTIRNLFTAIEFLNKPGRLLLNRPNMPLIMASKPIFTPDLPSSRMPTGFAYRLMIAWKAWLRFVKRGNRCIKASNIRIALA